jgi:hypothetical protein
MPLLLPQSLLLLEFYYILLQDVIFAEFTHDCTPITPYYVTPYCNTPSPFPHTLPATTPFIVLV